MRSWIAASIVTTSFIVLGGCGNTSERVVQEDATKFCVTRVHDRVGWNNTIDSIGAQKSKEDARVFTVTGRVIDDKTKKYQDWTCVAKHIKGNEFKEISVRFKM